MQQTFIRREGKGNRTNDNKYRQQVGFTIVDTKHTGVKRQRVCVISTKK
jgi:hypothetical protein